MRNHHYYVAGFGDIVIIGFSTVDLRARLGHGSISLGHKLRPSRREVRPFVERRQESRTIGSSTMLRRELESLPLRGQCERFVFSQELPIHEKWQVREGNSKYSGNLGEKTGAGAKAMDSFMNLVWVLSWVIRHTADVSRASDDHSSLGGSDSEAPFLVNSFRIQEAGALLWERVMGFFCRVGGSVSALQLVVVCLMLRLGVGCRAGPLHSLWHRLAVGTRTSHRPSHACFTSPCDSWPTALVRALWRSRWNS